MSQRHWPIGETPRAAGGSYLELCPSELTEPWPGLLSSPNMEAFFLDWPEDRLCIDTLLKQPDGTFPRRPSASREPNHNSCLWSNWAGLSVQLECLLFPEEDVKPVPLLIFHHWGDFSSPVDLLTHRHLCPWVLRQCGQGASGSEVPD